MAAAGALDVAAKTTVTTMVDDEAVVDVLGVDDMTGSPAKSVENQFMMQEGSATTLGGFSGSVHERTIDKVTDTITVYSNRGAPKAVLFNTYYG